jgi:hypothetical protein
MGYSSDAIIQQKGPHDEGVRHARGGIPADSFPRRPENAPHSRGLLLVMAGGTPQPPKAFFESFKAFFLSLKESFYDLKSSFYGLKSSFYGLKSSFYRLKCSLIR